MNVSARAAGKCHYPAATSTGSGNSLGWRFLVRGTCTNRLTMTSGMHTPAGPSGRQERCSQWIFHLCIPGISRTANCMARNGGARTAGRRGPGEGETQTAARTRERALQRLCSPFISIQEQMCFKEIGPLPPPLPEQTGLELLQGFT